MIPYQEIIFPELVNDVQDIFWNHIDNVGNQPLITMRKEGIISVEEPSIPSVEYKEISRLRLKYPFLDPHLLVFKLRPGFATEIHLDGHPENGRIKQRNVSINIPISGCNELGITEFYDNPEDNFYLEKKFNVRVLKKECIPIKTLEYSLRKNPILTCPQVPHRINNLLNTEYRISVSWTLDLSWSWKDTINYFSEKIKQYNLL